MSAASAASDPLPRCSEIMNSALAMSTGLSALDRSMVTYWSLATHMLPQLKTFPLLVLRGPMGTGKSECLNVVSRFSHKPRQFVMRGYTQPMIRDELIHAYEGTALIEEADQGWKDGDLSFERLLSDRYQRGTAKAGVNRQNGDGDRWQRTSHNLFGATALHRRVPFADAALDGRSITIRFRACLDRGYVDSDNEAWIREGYTLASNLSLQPTEIDQPLSVAPRIFNSYKPLLIIASLCNDPSFTEQIMERLIAATEEIKEAQSLEPDGLVLRAVLNIVSNSVPSYGSIRLVEVSDWIRQNHEVYLLPRQVGGLVRSLGIVVREISGVSVIKPSPSSLVAAINQVGYDNEEEVEMLKRQIPGFKQQDWD